VKTGDQKQNFDMKTFWKNTNEKYFRKLDKFSPNEVNHLVNSYAKYGIILILIYLDIHSDGQFTKVGFPRTVNCLVGKTQDLASST
jgi:hypothetical protein